MGRLEFMLNNRNIRVLNIPPNKERDLILFLGKVNIPILKLDFLTVEFNDDESMKFLFNFLRKDPKQGLRVIRTDFNSVIFSYHNSPDSFEITINDLGSYKNFLNLCSCINHNGFLFEIGRINYFITEEIPEEIQNKPVKLQRWNCCLYKTFSCKNPKQMILFLNMFCKDLSDEDKRIISLNFTK